MAETITRQLREPFVEAAGLGITNKGLGLLGTSIPTSTYTGRDFVAGQTSLETGAQTAAEGLGALTGIGAALPTGVQAGSIEAYTSPYQQQVIDASIAAMDREQQRGIGSLRDSAVSAGAFGGGREGVQQAELQSQTLGKMGESLAQGFQSAAGLAGQQQGIQQAGAQIYGQMGQQQQAMSQSDINQQMMAGSLQRGVGQQGLEATRQTALQKAYEPYQRVEFLKGIMTNLPTTQSSITATTAPGANPLSQAVGTGLGAYSAYNMMQPRK